MPRLGVPANIEYVSARFRQPGEQLNPLGLTWRMPQAIILKRVRLGSRSFRAAWLLPGGRWTPLAGMSAQPLIPLAAAAAGLFQEQVEPWKAYRSDGAEEPLITEEISKQLSAFYRRAVRPRKGAAVYVGQRSLAGFG